MLMRKAFADEKAVWLFTVMTQVRHWNEQLELIKNCLEFWVFILIENIFVLKHYNKYSQYRGLKAGDHTAGQKLTA